MTHPDLLVRWGDEAIGRLARTPRGPRFTYDRSAIEHHGLGVPLISLSLPTSLRPFPPARCLPFFDGLLPEGENRRIVAYDFGVRESDTHALLTELGRECAGALWIGPPDAPPTDAPTLDHARPIGHAELERRVADLRTDPLGIDRDVRVSLGGVQEKLLVTRLASGWALPTLGSASTHIIKPGRADMPGHVRSEALSLRFASELGVPAAVAELTTLADRDAIVVRRFDRVIVADRSIQRLHQENACQALGVRVAAVPLKYEQHGGPGWRAIAAALRRWASVGDVEMLLRHVVVDLLVGNADAHAMNTSFLHPAPGRISLAPMYDVFGSLMYPVSTTLGMFVNGQRDIRAVTAGDIIAEARSWGLAADRVDQIVASMLAAAPQAATRAIAATPEARGALAEFLVGRIDSFTA